MKAAAPYRVFLSFDYVQKRSVDLQGRIYVRAKWITRGTGVEMYRSKECADRSGDNARAAAAKLAHAWLAKQNTRPAMSQNVLASMAGPRYIDTTREAAPSVLAVVASSNESAAAREKAIADAQAFLAKCRRCDRNAANGTDGFCDRCLAAPVPAPGVYHCTGQFNGKPCPGAVAHRPGMCALAGVQELRSAVAWADNQPESDHDWKTAEQILAAYRAVVAEWEGRS